MRVGLTSGLLSPTLRVALSVGVLGGFTTYSTFNYETLEYLRAGAHGLGLANVLATVGGCLIAGHAGLAAGQWWLGR